jgi:hypothetical protein
VRVARGIVVLLGIAAAAQPAYRFFAEETAKRLDFTLHVLHFGLREIEATPALRAAPDLCIGGNPWITQEMRLPHVRNGWSYYLPRTNVEVAELRSSSPTDGLYISTSCEPKENEEAWRVHVYCSELEPFVCPSPRTHRKEVHIYVDAAIGAAR